MGPTQGEDNDVTLAEAAASLGVTAGNLRHQIANGRLKAARHGRDWWVTRGEVERYRRESRGRPGRRSGPAKPG